MLNTLARITELADTSMHKRASRDSGELTRPGDGIGRDEPRARRDVVSYRRSRGRWLPPVLLGLRLPRSVTPAVRKGDDQPTARKRLRRAPRRARLTLPRQLRFNAASSLPFPAVHAPAAHAPAVHAPAVHFRAVYTAQKGVADRRQVKPRSSARLLALEIDGCIHLGVDQARRRANDLLVN